MAVLVTALVISGILPREERIVMKGSDTMVILAQRWAEKYMTTHPEVVIQVSGGGSGTGIAALANGTADMCTSSRPMKQSERNKLIQRYGSPVVEIKSALDGLSVYVNIANPVQELTLKQIRDIYSGRMTDWKEAGGGDRNIVVYGRESNSGTYVYFRDEVLIGEPYSNAMRTMPGTAAIVAAVASDTGAIGYGGAAYSKGIREIKVRKNAWSKAYAPTLENITSGEYPIRRFLYVYVRNTPAGVIQEYIDWILSDEGQEIVREVGYFPIR